MRAGSSLEVGFFLAAIASLAILAAVGWNVGGWRWPERGGRRRSPAAAAAAGAAWPGVGRRPTPVGSPWRPARSPAAGGAHAACAGGRAGQLRSHASAQPAAAAAPADWYPDPRGEKRLRYWDGSQWTDHTAD